MSEVQLISAEELRKRRKSAGLTQKELARRAGVSQSLIARIENKTVDPRLSTVRKIIAVITAVQKQIKTALDLMHSPVITLEAWDTVQKAVEMMKTHAISQVPVLSGDNVVGFVQESTLINELLQRRDVDSFFSSSVYTIMDKTIVTVKSDTTVDVITRLLSTGNPAVLVMDEKRKIIGIITKIDVLSPQTPDSKL
jgi:predicted transcriptional regulator